VVVGRFVRYSHQTTRNHCGDVVGTVRAGVGRTLLHDLADAFPGRLEIELLDINEPAQIASLRERLAGRSFDSPG
jgi:hypothetical protein